jgi:N-acetylglucosaminyl-diphospho-decaprenol L-rhamnosyltransferase
MDGRHPHMRDVSPAEGTGAPVLCVAVSYNSARYLPDHLTSLLAQSPPPARVMVVDNASSDGSTALVRSAFPQVEVIANDRNVGYGAAANQGIAAAMEAGCPYVLITNPDLVLEEGGLAALTRALAECPSAAAAGPAVVEAGGRASAEGAAGVRSVRWLSGCILLLRVEALRRAGAFHPGYFLYAEETDLECRLRAAGWTLLAVPGAVAEHVGSGSARRFLGGARVCYYQMRNAFLFAKRNRWREGPRAWGADLCHMLGWVVTPRRLLHPTRLAALGLGLAAGLWQLAVARPAPRPTPEMGPGEGPGVGGPDGLGREQGRVVTGRP